MAQKLISTTLAVVLPLVVAQQIGKTPDVHPQLPTWKCTTRGGCFQQSTSVVLDSNWRGMAQVADPSQSCSCLNNQNCAQNCELENANYTTSGISVSDDSLTLYQFLNGNSVAPRVYLLDDDGDYKMLQLNGQELRFDVDASSLVCGENGALYLTQMDPSGGRSSNNNPGGANYGTGYCDAQCPVLQFNNGTLNTNGAGSCCNEMDVWEANSQANAMTPHACQGDSCDTSGCGYNPYAKGFPHFYGPGLKVDTNDKITVITQFLTHDNSTSGSLTKIKRQYIVNGNLIGNPNDGSITTDSCASSGNYGGLETMGTALKDGMVLVFSIWTDKSGFMNWLDSSPNGPCDSTVGNPTTMNSNPGSNVTFSNIRWGDIGSTGGKIRSSSTTTPTKRQLRLRL